MHRKIYTQSDICRTDIERIHEDIFVLAFVVVSVLVVKYIQIVRIVLGT